MLKLYSPAKLNLFLQITGKRPDGYHDLASLFQTITLFDVIHFALQNEDELTCTDSTIPTDESNLILKAANLFREKTGLQFGLRAHLEKRIPHQAGLGGGSGNAATTLWALNQLLKYPATTEELSEWSAEIGSDIAFFFSQGTAFCTGRGEIVHTLPRLPQTALWVIKPNEGLSTPVVYGNLDLKKLPSRDPKKALQSFLSGQPLYFNDLEDAALSAMPSLAKFKEQLKETGFHTVVMSGSGSSFFCLGDASPGMSHYFCQPACFVNRSPDRWYGE